MNTHTHPKILNPTQVAFIKGFLSKKRNTVVVIEIKMETKSLQRSYSVFVLSCRSVRERHLLYVHSFKPIIVSTITRMNCLEAEKDYAAAITEQIRYDIDRLAHHSGQTATAKIESMKSVDIQNVRRVDKGKPLFFIRFKPKEIVRAS